MKLVHIAEQKPVTKPTRKEIIADSARLLASQLRGTGRRKAQRILEIELEKDVFR